MPPDPWTEALRLSECAAIVAGAVVPTTMLLVWLNRRWREPILPRMRPWPVPWTGLDVSLLILVVVMLPSVVGEFLGQTPLFQWFYGPEFPDVRPGSLPSVSASASVAGAACAGVAHEQFAELQTVKTLWAGVVALPFQLGLVAALRVGLYPSWRTVGTMAPRKIPARLVLAGRVWLVLTPLVFCVHFAVVAMSQWFGSPLEDHPLTRIGPGRPTLDRVLFVLQACVIAPWIEELLCRGILLPWSARRSHRPWLVLAAAGLVAFLLGGTSEDRASRYGTAVFVAVLSLIALGVSCLPHSRRANVTLRRHGAVFASAAFFASLHASVWPSPLPLFVLALGLGWLALATRGILAPVVVHGLFNAVSVVFVLRGGMG